MNKLRLRVVAHTAAVQAESGIAQAGGGHAGNANVDSFAEHVLTVLCDSDSSVTQEFVAPRRAIAANDIDFRAGMTDGGSQIAEQIEKARIEIDDISGAMVAEKMV